MPSTQHLSHANDTLTLAAVEQNIWQLLEYGSKNPSADYHTGTLGTLSAQGVSMRTVILRAVDASEQTLFCYTDVRSDKAGEIRANPAVSWLFWNNGQKIQLRLNGTAAIHTGDAFAHSHWQNTSPVHRKNYLAQQAPGTVLPFPVSGLPEGLDTGVPTAEESEEAKVNFAVIRCRISFIDWLLLDSRGHRRAQFSYEAGKPVSKQWVVP